MSDVVRTAAAPGERPGSAWSVMGSNVKVGIVDDPAAVKSVVEARERAYGGSGPGDFGMTEYDIYGEHLVAVSRKDGRPLGSMRLGAGPGLLTYGGPEKFALSRYWNAGPSGVQLLQSSLEVGRVWITDYDVPGRREILPALWLGLQEYLLRNPELEHVVGAVALPDYAPAAALQVCTHFAQFHGRPEYLFETRWPAPVETAVMPGGDRMEILNALNQNLRAVNRKQGVPPLLFLYASVGMRLLAPPGYDETGRGILLPVDLEANQLAPSFAALRGQLQSTT